MTLLVICILIGSLITVPALYGIAKALRPSTPHGSLNCPTCCYAVNSLWRDDGPTTCPECGFQSSQLGDFSRRRRRWKVAGYRAVVLLCGLGVLSIPALRYINVTSQLPTFVLAYGLRWCDPSGETAIRLANELDKRRPGDSLRGVLAESAASILVRNHSVQVRRRLLSILTRLCHTPRLKSNAATSEAYYFGGVRQNGKLAVALVSSYPDWADVEGGLALWIALHCGPPSEATREAFSKALMQPGSVGFMAGRCVLISSKSPIDTAQLYLASDNAVIRFNVVSALADIRPDFPTECDRLIACAMADPDEALAEKAWWVARDLRANDEELAAIAGPALASEHTHSRQLACRLLKVQPSTYGRADIIEALINSDGKAAQRAAQRLLGLPESKTQK